MSDLKMGPVETRFAEIIWDREPEKLSSTNCWLWAVS